MEPLRRLETPITNGNLTQQTRQIATAARTTLQQTTHDDHTVRLAAPPPIIIRVRRPATPPSSVATNLA